MEVKYKMKYDYDSCYKVVMNKGKKLFENPQLQKMILNEFYGKTVKEGDIEYFYNDTDSCKTE